MSSQTPQCSADMKSLRKGESPRRSRSASQDRTYDGDLEEVLAAINELNGLPRRKTCSLLGTGDPERVHCLPHSDHRTLRQHKYLYYAGLISRAGSKSQQQRKGSVQNISLLDQILHTRMDRFDAFVWMAELEEVIESCEHHLAAIEQNGGHGFETFQSSSFLQDWSIKLSLRGRDVALCRYQPWVLPRQTKEEHKEDKARGLVSADFIHVRNEEHLVFPSPAPFKYTPALPTRLLSLDPFIATLMAMTTLERRPDYDSITFDQEARVMLQRAEYLLELCEVDTPSSWRTLARPPLTSSLPPPSSATPCRQRRLFQAQTYERQQAKRGRKSGDSEASSSRGRRPRIDGRQGEEGTRQGQAPTDAAEGSGQERRGLQGSGLEESGKGESGKGNDEQVLDSAMSSPKELQGSPDLSFSVSTLSVSTLSDQSGPRTPSEQWHTWSPPGKPTLRRETSLTLAGLQSLTMQEAMAEESDSNEGTATPDRLEEDTQEELEAKLERSEAACEAERRSYLEECSNIIERHFRADCDARGFSLAMRSLRKTAKHPADDELSARHKVRQEQEECFRKRRNELIDALNDLLP